MTNKIKNHKELRIWQEGIAIVKIIYGLTKRFPIEERYGLVSQMTRAAVSIPSNIAEGFIRYRFKEFSQFLRIALGSAAELDTQLIIAKELGFIKEPELQEINRRIDYFSRMVSRLLQKLKSENSKN
jgi:four helix bundle protein